MMHIAVIHTGDKLIAKNLFSFGVNVSQSQRKQEPQDNPEKALEYPNLQANLKKNTSD